MDLIPLDITINIINYLNNLNEFKNIIAINKKYFKSRNFIFYQLYKFIIEFTDKNLLDKYLIKKNWFFEFKNQYFKMLRSDITNMKIIHSDNPNYWEFRLSHWHCNQVCWFDILYECQVYPGSYNMYVVMNLNSEGTTNHICKFETIILYNNNLKLQQNKFYVGKKPTK